MSITVMPATMLQGIIDVQDSIKAFIILKHQLAAHTI
jgi:hypothetical protein